MSPNVIDFQIFRRPCFYHDDNFDVWTGANHTTDGDIATLTIPTGGTEAVMTDDFAGAMGPTATNRFAYVNCTALTGSSWDFRIYYGEVLRATFNFTTPGLKEIDLWASPWPSLVDKIDLRVNGAASQYAKFDFVIFPSSGKYVASNDVLGDIQVEKASNGALAGMTAKLSLTTTDYSDLKGRDHAILWVNNKKLFGGRCAGVKKIWRRNAEFCEVKMIDLGWEILASDPTEVRKKYTNQTLKQMVQDLLSVASVRTLSDYGVDPDSQFTTQHNILFDTITVYDALRSLSMLENVEWNVDAAGNVWFYPKGKYASSLTVNQTNTYEAYRDRDWLSVRNTIYRYGARNNTDGEIGTETGNDWFHTGFDSIGTDAVDYKVGALSIKGTAATAYAGEINIRYIGAAIKSAFWNHEAKGFKFWAKITADQPERVDALILELRDQANKKARINLGKPSTVWVEYHTQAGWQAGWQVESGFDWQKIDDYYWILVISGGNVTNLSFRVDGAYWEKIRTSGNQFNSTSRADHGFLYDAKFEDELLTDAQCTNKAIQTLTDLKDGKEQVQLTVAGDDYKPGYVQTISLGTFLSGDYRIASVNHRIDRNLWRTQLNLGKISGGKFTEFTKSQIEETKRLGTQVKAD